VEELGQKVMLYGGDLQN